MKPTLPLMQRMVGNPKAYAVQKEDWSWFPRRQPLSAPVLRRHLNGEETVGTYILNGDVARTLVFDCDTGEDALDDAVSISGALGDVGIPQAHTGIEFSGRKGYHVWVILSGYLPASQLRRLGRTVLSLAKVDCEVFPKQDSARDLGNLVKLPGGIHRVTGNPNDFVTALPKTLPVPLFKRIVADLPEEPKRVSSGAPDPFPCMAAIQEGGLQDGEGRNNALYHLAVMARRGGINADNVEELVRRTNDTFAPPLEEAEVAALLRSAQHAGPICSQLSDEVHCGDLCISRRERGLYCRPGQLKHGGNGELAVVTLGKRKGNVVELEHPDIGAGKVVIA